jgi:pimeloyl-ACP methyl ester carboxylesterase
VVIWQGDADTLVPVTWGERLAQRIPGAELRLCRGDGHFLALGRYAEILAALAPPGAPAG